MADISSTLAGWSSTTASNSPADTTAISSGLAGNLRELQGVVIRGLSHKGSDIASAATTDLGGTEGLGHDISGTTTITSFGTGREGLLKILQFDGALTLTHNATSLVLPGGVNITTAAKDVAVMFSEGSGNWRCYGYFSAASGAFVNINGLTEDTAAVDASDYVMTYDGSASLHKKVALKRMSGYLDTEAASTSGTSVSFTSIPTWVKKITVMFIGVSTNGTSNLQIQLGDAGGIETSGYISNAFGANNSGVIGTTSSAITTGFLLMSVNAAAATWHGSVIINLEDASDFSWVCQGALTRGDTGTAFSCSGYKATSAALDRISITTVNGTDAFDAGAINVLYE